MGQGTIDSRASLRRAAILMTTFDDRVARALLGKLPPMQRARLRRAISDLEDVDPLERRRAQNDFFQETRQQTLASDATPTTFDTESVELRLQNSNAGGQPNDSSAREPDVPPLAFLSDVPDDVLLGAIVGEHPQTIAIVLASLAPHQAARLLPGLSESLRAEALTRLSRLEQLPPDALDSIGDHLRRLLADARPQAIGAGAGGRSLQAILAELPNEARDGVAAALGIDPQQLPANSQASVATGGNASASSIAEPSIAGDAASESAAKSEPDQFSGPRIAAETRVTSKTPAAAPNNDGSSHDSLEERIDIEQVDAFVAELSTDDLRDALSRLETRQALLALCGLSRKDADRVLRSLPRRQAKQIRKQLAELGTLTISEVDDAKRQVAVSMGMRCDSKPAEGAAHASVMTAA